jgi:hypothetical protein
MDETAPFPSRRDVHPRLSPFTSAVAAPGAVASSAIVPAAPAPPAAVAPSPFFAPAPTFPPPATTSVAPAAWAALAPVPAPGRNPFAMRALVVVLIGAAATVFLLALHLPVYYRVISSAIGLILSIRAIVAATRTGAGWIASIASLAIAVILSIVTLVAGIAALAPSGPTFGQRVGEVIREQDHASSVVCPSDAPSTAGASFTCVLTMPDGSTQEAAVTVTSDGGISWRRTAVAGSPS